MLTQTKAQDLLHRIDIYNILHIARNRNIPYELLRIRKGDSQISHVVAVIRACIKELFPSTEIRYRTRALENRANITIVLPDKLAEAIKIANARHGGEYYPTQTTLSKDEAIAALLTGIKSALLSGNNFVSFDSLSNSVITMAVRIELPREDGSVAYPTVVAVLAALDTLHSAFIRFVTAVPDIEKAKAAIELVEKERIRKKNAKVFADAVTALRTIHVDVEGIPVTITEPVTQNAQTSAPVEQEETDVNDQERLNSYLRERGII